MADSHSTATPEETKASAIAHPPVPDVQKASEPEIDRSGMQGVRAIQAIGGGSPETPPEQYAGALGQLSGRSQAGMLRQLQRSYGNSYVGRVIQAKLTVNQPGDIYEQEADRMAAHVVMPKPELPIVPVASVSQPLGGMGIQRQCSECEQGMEEGKNSDEMASGAGIQTKLTVGAVGDRYEQEADRVAAQVMSVSVAPNNSPQVQRFGEEDNPVQMWPLAQSITPVVHRRVDEQVQMRELVQRAFQAGGNEASGDLESRLNGSKGGGSALAPEVRAFMEPRFGADFSGVRVHTGSEAVQMNRELGAQAFAHGSDVYFGAGKSPGNNELTAHELTHVVQQGIGGDAGATHISGSPTLSQYAPPFNIQRQEATPKKTKAEDAAFWEWWKLVVGYEGSLEAWKANPVNEKNDRGGETNWGVTKELYMSRAKALGLPATEAGFAAMTPDQAMLFGRMIWKSSGVSKIKNKGVAIVLADWYWGGIDLDRLSALLKHKGRAATFKQGTLDVETIDFMNTLLPGELVELMSDAKAAQYREIAKDPKQKVFLEGWLKRSKERRRQAQPFAFPPAALLSRGQGALDQARSVLQRGEAASYEDKKAANDELWTVVGIIEQHQKAGFATAEEGLAMKNLKEQLLKEIGRLMDAGS